MIHYFGYVILSHGPKPTGPLGKHEAARQQLINLNAYQRAEGIENVKVAFDYAREVKNLDALPDLKYFLDRAKGRPTKIIIDDYRRIFHRCPIPARQELLNELLKYGPHFADMRLKLTLGGLDNAGRALLLNDTGPVKFQLEPTPPQRRPSSKMFRKKQTSAATMASQKTRNLNADKKAKELSELKQRLAQKNLRPTLAEIAKAANEEGLKTTRGGNWTTSSVQRVLKRIEGKET